MTDAIRYALATGTKPTARDMQQLRAQRLYKAQQQAKHAAREAAARAEAERLAQQGRRLWEQR